MVTGIIILTFLLILFGMPVSFSMGLGSLLFLNAYHNLSFPAIAHKMFHNLDGFVMMAVPFFIVMANFMASGETAKRLINFLNSFLKRFPGGIGVAVMVACAIFAAMCGSGSAASAAFAIFVIPLMTALGYDKAFVAGLVASGGGLAILIPPSLSFIFYGAITGESVGALFLAGVVPGMIVTIALCLVIMILAKRRNYAKDDTVISLKDILNSFKKAIWSLMIPLIVLGGIYGGVFTPTEAAAAGAVYVLILSVFIEKSIKGKEILNSLSRSMELTANIFLIVAAALLFGFALTLEEVPQKILYFMNSLNLSKMHFLMLINVFMLIMGCFLDSASVILITTPIIYPIVKALGIDPIQFGVVMTLNLEIGLLTPPFGMNLFIVSGVAKIPPEQVARGALPFLIVLFLGLILVTYVPIVSLWLPKLVGF